jgi:hypothetical protein
LYRTTLPAPSTDIDRNHTFSRPEYLRTIAPVPFTHNVSSFQSNQLWILDFGLKCIPPHVPPGFETTLRDAAKDFNRRVLTYDFFRLNPPRNERDYDPLLVRPGPTARWVPPITRNTATINSKYRNFLTNLDETWETTELPTIGSKPSRELQISAIKFYRTLKSDKSIIINMADKNVGLTIIDTTDYIRHLRIELQKPQYTLLPGVTPEALLDALNIQQKRAARDFTNEFSLTMQERDFILDRTSTSNSYLYLLLKLHKNKVNHNTWKTRPIVSNVNAPFQSTSILVTKLLQKNLHPGPSILKNSQDLIDCIGLLGPLPPNAILFTIDYSALYTNIDLARLYTALAAVQTPPAILRLIRATLSASYFTVGNEVYRQVNGIKMGTNEAVILANTYLDHYTDSNVKDHPNLLLYKRFIDDIIGIWNGTHQELTQFVNWLKSFTPELSIEYITSKSTVDFLDLTLRINQARVVEYSIYSKPISTFQYIPGHSQHSPGHFKGFIIGELTRIHRYSSTDAAEFLERQKFWDRLIRRGYSTNYLSRHFSRAMDQAQPVRDEVPIPFKIGYSVETPTSLIQTYCRDLTRSNVCPDVRFIPCYTTSPNIGRRIATFRLDQDHMAKE